MALRPERSLVEPSITTRIGSGSIGSGGSSGAIKKFGPVIADQLIRRISEYAREVSVLWILDRLAEFNPEVAAPRLGRGIIFLVPNVRRQRDAGGRDLRHLRRRSGDRKRDLQLFRPVILISRDVLLEVRDLME